METPAQPERASEHRETVKERAHERREAAREKAQEVTTVRGREMTRGDIFKFGGLIAFFALMVIVVILIWPYIHEAFEPGGLSRVIDDVRNAGPLGFLILLAMQFMQIVVAFIPGEVVQMAAGMMYGPWLGAAVVLLGCIISSAFVFAVVHRLGAPFVRDMVPTKYLDKFNAFEESVHRGVHLVLDSRDAQRHVHVSGPAHEYAHARFPRSVERGPHPGYRHLDLCGKRPGGR